MKLVIAQGRHRVDGFVTHGIVRIEDSVFLVCGGCLITAQYAGVVDPEFLAVAWLEHKDCWPPAPEVAVA